MILYYRKAINATVCLQFNLHTLGKMVFGILFKSYRTLLYLDGNWSDEKENIH
jgi:hypothetical protein